MAHHQVSVGVRLKNTERKNIFLAGVRCRLCAGLPVDGDRRAFHLHRRRKIRGRALIDDERDAGGITIGQPKIGKVGSPVTGNGIGDVPNIPRGAVKGERRCARDRVGVGLKIFNRSRHRHGIRHRERRDARI